MAVLQRENRKRVAVDRTSGRGGAGCAGLTISTASIIPLRQGPKLTSFRQSALLCLRSMKSL
ncbi:hypothetical protein [Desulfospira joergensenii]|uniref:hypothetical protein n=1 Tax=Desulfospira joergensenii TaxID=53329 RepID=UPI0003B483BB|nr:hypothetical protein [Desulfospira joergensenii]